MISFITSVPDLKKVKDRILLEGFRSQEKQTGSHKRCSPLRKGKRNIHLCQKLQFKNCYFEYRL